MKKNCKYGNIYVLIWLLAVLILPGLIYSCKSKTASHDEMSSDMKDMRGMEHHDMSQMNHPKMKADTPKISTHIAINIDDLLKPVNQEILSQIPTFKAVKEKRDLLVHAKGVIDYDQRRFTNVASRVTGRIESTNIKFPFQPVKKGELLFTVYSPDLLNVQQDFLLMLDDPNNQSLIAAGREKLSLLGFSHEQVAEIERSRKPMYSVGVYSPAEGYVITGNSPSNPVTSMKSSEDIGMNMGAANPESLSVPSSNESITRVGQYINKGETVFRIANTDIVWALLKIYPDDAEKIKMGNKVEVFSDGLETPQIAAIDFIEKNFLLSDKTATARIYLVNVRGLYKPGNLVSATISAGIHNAMWVPASAVLDLGNSRVIFVRQGNFFKATRVHTGLRNGDELEVLDGIPEGSEIATNAEYLVDSEAFIKAE